MSHEHGGRQVERVEEGHDEPGVGGIAVACARSWRGLVRETKSAVVERDDPIPGGEHGEQRLAPAVDRRREAVNEHDRDAAPGIDHTQLGAVHDAVLCAKRRTCRIALLNGDLRRTARCGGREGQEHDDAPGHHAAVPKARRASMTIKGWEVHTPATASPAPVATTTWASSTTSSVAASAGSDPETSPSAPGGTPPAMRSSTVAPPVRVACRHPGSGGRHNSAASTPSTRRSARATS